MPLPTTTMRCFADKVDCCALIINFLNFDNVLLKALARSCFTISLIVFLVVKGRASKMPPKIFLYLQWFSIFKCVLVYIFALVWGANALTSSDYSTRAGLKESVVETTSYMVLLVV